jgi:hypothetical protein
VQFFDAVSGDLHRRAMGGIIPKNLRAGGPDLHVVVTVTAGSRPIGAIPGPIPDNARLASYLPFEWMLPKEVPPRATAEN